MDKRGLTEEDLEEITLSGEMHGEVAVNLDKEIFELSSIGMDGQSNDEVSSVRMDGQSNDEVSSVGMDGRLSDEALRGSSKFDLVGFLWQHLMLVISLFIMTFGVALCVRSALGSSVISTIPFVMTLAGENGLIKSFTIGEWTYVMNFVLVGLQIVILRRQFELTQLFQLIIGFLFGWLLDLNMALTEVFPTSEMMWKVMAQLLGCTVLGAGIAFEIKCGSVTMPGEGLPAAICKLTGKAFPKVKIMVDVALVTIAVILGFIFFDCWLWQVVGIGTLFAMIYVGAVVKFITPRIGWFDRMLCYRPGFRRYLYGLAGYLKGSMRR